MNLRTSHPAAQGPAARLPPAARPRLEAVRQAFHSHRLASTQYRLWLFYLEHNMFDQAVASRRLMLDHLHDAGEHLRRTLAVDC